jgi:hypothetical protein
VLGVFGFFFFLSRRRCVTESLNYNDFNIMCYCCDAIIALQYYYKHYNNDIGPRVCVRVAHRHRLSSLWMSVLGNLSKPIYDRFPYDRHENNNIIDRGF